MRWSIVVALALLAGCNSREPEPEPAPGQTADTAGEIDAPAPSTSQPEQAGLQDSGTGIPPAMQGRWGLVAADCDPGRDDAKGLMVVDQDGLEFYESVATLDEATERSAQKMRATFDFTGEGMSWERDMALTIEDGGETLVRREYGDDAAPAPLEYTRCG